MLLGVLLLCCLLGILLLLLLLGVLLLCSLVRALQRLLLRSGRGQPRRERRVGCCVRCGGRGRLGGALCSSLQSVVAPRQQVEQRHQALRRVRAHACMQGSTGGDLAVPGGGPRLSSRRLQVQQPRHRSLPAGASALSCGLAPPDMCGARLASAASVLVCRYTSRSLARL